MTDRRLVSGEALLLLECVNADPVHPYASDLFPYLQGWAREEDLTVRWLRLGLGSSASQLQPELLEGAMAALEAELEAGPEVMVFCNVRLGPATQERLKGPGREWLFNDASFAISDRTGLRRVLDWLGHLEAFTEAHPQLVHLADAMPVDYRSVTIGGTEQLPRRIFEITTGHVCAFRKPLWDNPHFVPLALEPTEDHRACSFCLPPPRQSLFSRSPIELAVEHVAAIHQAEPDEGHEFAFSSSVLLLKLEPLLEGLFELPLQPSTFLFSCRIDEITRMAPALEAAQIRLLAAGHRMGIQRLGLENFSPVENERLGKDLSPETIATALEWLERMEREHPESFAFHAYGGLGFITFTPWTRLEDLAINLEQARHFRVREVGFFLRSRLQLLPGRPITKLAEHDGLVIGEDEEPSFFSGCIHYADIEEVPWRFRDPVVAMIYAVARRISENPDLPEDDPITEPVREFLLDLPLGALGHLDLLQLLLRAARGEPPAELEQLLGRAREIAREEAVSDAPGAEGWSGRRIAGWLQALVEREPEALPGFTIEGVEVDAPAVVLLLRRGGARLRLLLALPGHGLRVSAKGACFDVGQQVDPIRLEAAANRLARRAARLLDRGPWNPRRSG